MKGRARVALVYAASFVACLLAACGGTPVASGPSTTGGTVSHETPQEPVGIVERADLETRLDAWREARAQASPLAEAATALGEVEPGGEVTVYLGTWCGDSRREVTRLWAALDLLGAEPPFAITYVAVDRAKQAPGGLLDGVDLRYVPTFVVRRAGAEVGRIVESSPNGIETDLARLLRGEATGVISATR